VDKPDKTRQDKVRQAVDELDKIRQAEEIKREINSLLDNYEAKGTRKFFLEEFQEEACEVIVVWCDSNGTTHYTSSSDLDLRLAIGMLELVKLNMIDGSGPSLEEYIEEDDDEEEN